MWRRVSAQLQTLAPSWRSSLNLLQSNGRSSVRNPSFLASSSSSSYLFSTSVSDSSIGKKRVENIMLIATGHEREELEAEIEGRKWFDMDVPAGPFGTKETPAIVRSYYDKRIVGCPGGEGEDEHDVVWFWLEKDRPHECSVCSQYFMELFSVIARVQTFAAAFKMSYGSSSLGSGSMNARSFEFGRTHVVRPKGRHEATIVWLHGLGDNGSSWSQLLETLPLPNIKWICPTAPTRPVAIFGGFPCTAWFDVGDLSEDGPDDLEGLDASAAHVANLLSTEPADIKLGIGGFSMGAAIALYSATCSAHGKYGNGNAYQVNLSAVVGLSGWLPCSRNLKNKIEGQVAARRAASLPLLLCHGKGDDVVLYKHGQKSAEVLTSTGFQNLAFKTYSGLGHYTVPEEMDDVCKWLTSKFGLDGSRS